MDGALIEPEVNHTEPLWNNLTDKEKSVLVAMLVGKTNAEAIKLAPVGKTQFYRYKMKLEPLKDQLISQITGKAVEVLQGSAIKAAEVLVDLLNSPGPKIRADAAVEVLNRTVGQAKKQEIINARITQIGIIGITNDDIKRLTEPLQEEFSANSEFK